jgi:hypothetical protein
VATSPVESDPGQLVRRSWAAAGAGTGTVAAATLFALLGVSTEFEFCLEGCPPDESGVGTAAIALFFAAAALLIVGLCWTAYVSRGTLGDALVRGALATGAVAAAALLVWLPLGVAGFAPGLVLAVGAAAAIVIREPAPLARYLRIGAIAVLALAATMDDNLALVLFSLLVFPAAGVADTIAIRLETGDEVHEADDAPPASPPNRGC